MWESTRQKGNLGKCKKKKNLSKIQSQGDWKVIRIVRLVLFSFKCVKHKTRRKSVEPFSQKCQQKLDYVKIFVCFIYESIKQEGKCNFENIRNLYKGKKVGKEEAHHFLIVWSFLIVWGHSQWLMYRRLGRSHMLQFLFSECWNSIPEMLSDLGYISIVIFQFVMDSWIQSNNFPNLWDFRFS